MMAAIGIRRKKNYAENNEYWFLAQIANPVEPKLVTTT